MAKQKKSALPTDVITLQQMVHNLQQECKILKEERQRQQSTEYQQIVELERVYQQVTGQTLNPDWTIRDYAMAIYHYLDNIISLAPGHIFWLDRNNVYLGCNNAQAVSIGLPSRQAIVGKKNADLIWTAQAEQLNQANNEVMRSGKPLTIEEPLDLVGGYKIFLSEKVPLLNNHGEIIGLLGTAIDITAQKQEASWLKSEFIQNMSHDLKTPLMTIMGMAELLGISETDEERKHNLLVIHRAAKHMTDILNSILDAATLETSEVKRENIHIIEILQSLHELYQPLVKKKNLTLNINILPSVPEYIRTDKMRIYRILLNLIGNALKFTEKGSITVTADLENFPDKPKHFLLSIKDTGIGIPEDKVDLIFEKFVRLHSAYEGKYSGTGLGLSVVKRFTEELGATILVESKEGLGSTFILRFPID